MNHQEEYLQELGRLYLKSHLIIQRIDEINEIAEGCGFSNDPTGSLHVTSAEKELHKKLHINHLEIQKLIDKMSERWSLENLI
jgi:hypothetical protein